ncbi:hypothetical protein AVENP_2629 [Arcobacter venerupis]|uniref:Uncharacterized protein n=1 Tax=Arcobacter venerupis TaxID=1054033 RepID=A0AAE7E4P2_9BACT|nr:hypothetical protein [Arcobacter venerupis]QKF68125.1 hypothetical protein AVENP_2629 [Arcobacter venerupis]RWS48878.1 hypothetical protein CKA56_12130 [Arcobacter venerupis]
MQNDEITLSEAKRVTAELKASILKLDVLNQEVINNITQLQDLNSEMKDYTFMISKFEPKNEQEMIKNYSLYLSFLSQKLEDLGKNQELKKIEKIINLADKILNLSVLKVVLIVAVVTTGINFIILK